VAQKLATATGANQQEQQGGMAGQTRKQIRDRQTSKGTDTWIVSRIRPLQVPKTRRRKIIHNDKKKALERHFSSLFQTRPNPSSGHFKYITYRLFHKKH